ncbi:MAG TPA: caspase family protein, partial [Pseudonocardiaceae bacterium]
MADRRYRALLVTNWEFPDDPTGLPPLRGPQVDAGIMRAALTDERTGLHTAADVEVVANAGKQEVLLRLEDFFRDAGRDDQLLLYYSGHGQLDLAGRLFLCARDSKVDRLLATAVAARDISDLMDESRARAKVVVLDCCHSGGFKGGADLPEGLAGRGRFVLSSSLPGQRTKDAEDDTAGSPFTRFVVEVLSSGAPDDDHDGYVSVDDLYHHVTKRMSDAGLSTPQRRFDDAVASVAVARTPSQAPTPTVTPPIEPAPATLADFLKADGFERRGRPE